LIPLRPHTPKRYTLSLHDALPIYAVPTTTATARSTTLPRRRNFRNSLRSFICAGSLRRAPVVTELARGRQWGPQEFGQLKLLKEDRKSTRLNSSHLGNSYAVFCLK